MKTVWGDVKFLLKDARSDRPTLIYLVFRYENERFKTSTGLTIAPYQCDAANQRAYVNQKSRPVREIHQTINAGIDRHRAAFKTILTRLQLAGIPFDNETLKQHLNADMGHLKKTKPHGGPSEIIVEIDREPFTAFIERFVGLAEDGKRLNAKNAQYSRYILASYRVSSGIRTRYVNQVAKVRQEQAVVGSFGTTSRFPAGFKVRIGHRVREVQVSRLNQQGELAQRTTIVSKLYGPVNLVNVWADTEGQVNFLLITRFVTGSPGSCVCGQNSGGGLPYLHM